ncbi:helix-turn-helix domain-containing protein [Neobacillus mesonae]|nr:helix-turn-helix domain-containing protein [Neobacillus mesonae]
MSEIKIGDLIRAERIKEGFTTQKMFADKTGVSPATLSRIEKNTQKPNPETLMLFSKHLPNLTYADLMKTAGYLEGLQNEHESFIKQFLNENEELDNSVFDLLDTLTDFVNIDSSIHKSLVETFINNELVELYNDADSNTLKNEYCRNDFSIEEKKRILNKLENILSKFSPKLSKYLKAIKTPRPIPLVGNICAGDGIIANEEIEEYLSYPFPAQTQPDFALRVKGESMVNAGILNNDIVFFKKAAWPEYNGQIVAVVINGEEGTLKRMRWTENSSKFILSPENDSYQSMEVTPNEFVICGVYAGHFRQDS